MTPAVLCWSSGKDSALCLNRVLHQKTFEVRYLLTTLSMPMKRISMHGISEELLDTQVKSIGIPLIKVYNEGTSNASYEKQMESSLLKLKNEGINDVIFGDIFLEDLRKYREDMLAKVGMRAHFPLWKNNTSKLIKELEQEQIRSKVCCINDSLLNNEVLGKDISYTLVSKYMNNIDACGENGEYHSFCHDAPFFEAPIKVKKGELVTKTYPSPAKSKKEISFTFLDLLTA